MTDDTASRLARLAAIAALLRDRDMALLAAARRRQAQTEAAISGLSARMPDVTDMALPAIRQIELTHRHWAEPQRRSLAVRLMDESATCANALQAARVASGRRQVLEKLASAARGRGRKGQLS
jgi:hypothetical protein